MVKSQRARKMKQPLFVIQPSRSAFWRFALGTISVLSLLAVKGLLDRARQLGVDVPASLSWQAAFSFLFLLTALALLGLILSFTALREQIWDWLERPIRARAVTRGIGAVLLLTAITGFSLLFFTPYIRRIIGTEYEVRLFIFWMFSLVGMWGVKMLRKQTSWLAALVAVVLVQSALHLVLVHLSAVTSYPFSRGWSETSYFYYPSMFLSEEIYGQAFAWPVLHPTLHLLLAPPYLFEAPLWLHRLWQVMLRFLFVGLIVPALLARLPLKDSGLRGLVAIWTFLFLFIGPIYLHLAIPVILVLWGYSSRNTRRTWIVIVLASIWAGWSRVNWFPVPGMIAAVLYLMEEPVRRKNLWAYLYKPALFFVIGSLVAIASQRVYIALSGIPDSAYFFTSFGADLLWYRLLPNATYPLGVLPAVLFLSLPLYLAIYTALRRDGAHWHPARLVFIFGAWLVLFVGGLVVSARIGGGADLHNLDAYFVLTLIVSSYLIFARYRDESRARPKPLSLHWALVLWIAVTPVWFLVPRNAGFVAYDDSRASAVLEELQHYIDEANAAGGEILFISQRHLFSLGLLDSSPHVREYEREELMEMAQGRIIDYLVDFRSDMRRQRFALIVVDHLNYNRLGRAYPFSEENNVWVRRVVRPILCNYREEVFFPADEIALYVPQEGERQCP